MSSIDLNSNALGTKGFSGLDFEGVGVDISMSIFVEGSILEFDFGVDSWYLFLGFL